MTATDGEVLRGELRDSLVGAMQRVPDLAGRDLALRPLSGGITNRNFLVSAGGTDERWVIRLAGNDTHLLGISREVEHAATVAAAGVGVGPEVTAFIRPEGYLVTRFIEGSPVSDAAVHQSATLVRVAESLRRVHEGPPIPGLFIPYRIVEAYRALALARGVAIPPEYELALATTRRIELALLANPIELRPCHNDLLNANFIDDGARIRIVDWEYAGMGDRFFDLGNFSINHELTGDEDAELLAAYEGDVRADRLARLTLMRTVSDFREAMWGVLQQGISTLDVDFVAYAGEHFDRLLSGSTTPALRAVAARGGGGLTSAGSRELIGVGDRRSVTIAATLRADGGSAFDRPLDTQDRRTGCDRVLRNADRACWPGTRLPGPGVAGRFSWDSVGCFVCYAGRRLTAPVACGRPIGVRSGLVGRDPVDPSSAVAIAIGRSRPRRRRRHRHLRRRR